MGAVLRAWRGFSLPIAVMAMVGSGLALTAAFYTVASPGPERAPTAVIEDHALRIARLGLDAATSRIGSGALGALEEPVVVYASESGSALATYTISVRPLADSLLLVRSVGRVLTEQAEAVRSAEAVVAVPDPSAGPPAPEPLTWESQVPPLDRLIQL